MPDIHTFIPIQGLGIITKKMIIAIALAIAPLAASLAVAENECSFANGLTAANLPPGFHGVDPFAFVELDNRVEGNAEFSYCSIIDINPRQ